MIMQVGPGETAITNWQVVRIDQLVERVLGSRPEADPSPRFLAVDGRSGGGKSTLAGHLQQHIANATIVHTDDVAWHHSFFGWSELLIAGVLQPVRAQRHADYRPPAWEARGRQGSIVVPADCDVVIIEGVGASRLELAPWLTASIWIQSDLQEAERRGIARDGGTDEARRFWMDWMREENAFLQTQRPWARAAAIVNGTPDLTVDPRHEVVVAAPGPAQ